MSLTSAMNFMDLEAKEEDKKSYYGVDECFHFLS